MLYKLVAASKDEQELHKDKWGGFNDAPFGFIDVTNDEEASKSVSRRVFDGQSLIKSTEYRQILDHDSSGSCLSVKLFFFYDNSGVGLGSVWKPNVGFVQTYYKFGCEHKNVSSVKAGRCYYRNTCNDCGFKWSVDSSD